MREQPAKANYGGQLRRMGVLALLAGLSAVASASVYGQVRIAIPTPDTTAPAVTPPPGAYPSYGNAPADGGAVASPSNTVTPFGPAPTSGASPTLPPGGYGAPATGAAPGGMIYSPGPMATLNGTVQPPPPNFDPFGPPGAAPAAVVPQDPYYNNPQPCPPPSVFTLPPALAQGYRFIQDVSIDYHWFAGHGSNPDQLGINDIDCQVTFALPMPFFTQQQQASPQQQPQESMLLITPGFAFHFWDGPASTPENGFADMPARTYDAYLKAAWNPVFVPGAFSAELEASIGLYTDFTTITNQSIRLKGKAMAVIGIPETHLTMKLGVWYIDRGLVKLLPAGGFVWKPSPYTQFDILFPNPRFKQMLYTTAGGTEWWWYLTGEYGGGVWTIKRSADAPLPEQGKIDLVDYNDIRFALGIDFKCPAGQTGFFEGGYAFDRELVYASGQPSTFMPNGTFYLHSGVAF
jgi:hypothetical protein